MRWDDRLVLAMLALDGLVVGGLLIAWFVPVATEITAGAVRYAPLIAWLVPVCAGLLGGPGGDVLLYADWRTLLLVVFGVGAPVVTSWIRRGPASPRRGDGA